MNIQTNKYLGNTSFCTGHYKAPSTIEELSKYLSNNITLPLLIFCVGTDRCIGDALGPLTGTILKKQLLHLPVYGTVENPIHALNITSSLRDIKKSYPNSFIIAIDASLGNGDEIGNIIIRKSPLYPGKGVGKRLPAVGDLSIVGIVEDASSDVASTIHNIRLHFIMSMAEIIATIITNGLAINNFNNLS